MQNLKFRLLIILAIITFSLVIITDFIKDIPIILMYITNFLVVILAIILLKDYHAHASGHAPGPDIKRLMAEINAKKVEPIHTEHREMF